MTNGEKLHRLITKVLQTHRLTPTQEAQVKLANGSYEPDFIDYDYLETIMDDVNELIKLLKLLPKPKSTLGNEMLVTINSDLIELVPQYIKTYNYKSMTVKLSLEEYLQYCSDSIKRVDWVKEAKLKSKDVELPEDVKKFLESIKVKQTDINFSGVTQYIIDNGLLKQHHKHSIRDDEIVNLPNYSKLDEYLNRVFKGNEKLFKQYWDEEWKLH